MLRPSRKLGFLLLLFMAALVAVAAFWKFRRLNPVAMLPGDQTAPVDANAPRQNPDGENADPNQPKSEFERLKFTPLPHDGQDLTLGVKPGHWITATLDARANQFDFVGELEAGIINTLGLPIALEHTAYRLISTRPLSLPKGEPRRAEVLFFVPRSLTTTVATRLLTRGGGSELLQDRQPLSHLPAYEYFFYVLSSQPQRYRYLRILDTVKPPSDDSSNDRFQYYRVQLPRVGQQVALPTQALTWTSIAVLLWDDIHPKVLSADQQQALLDWLHWGGQLVVSGPRTLDLFAGSFLEPYLPAKGGDSLSLGTAELAELNRNWTVPSLKGLGKPLAVIEPWPGISLQLQDAGSFVAGTGNLIAERRVGRGRVVVTGFRLSETDLLTWPSLDSLVNNALLRRARRVYRDNDFALEPLLDWADFADRKYDASLLTNLRLFARDGGSASEKRKLAADVELPPDIVEMLQQMTATSTIPQFGLPTVPNTPAVPSRELRTELVLAHDGGTAAWNDFSPVTTAARQALRDAAGIVVPRSSFILWVVGLYLLVVGPLNWLVFWALGKLEWAWIAAPLIAIACTLTVVRMARLDIGFARAQTDVTVIELQTNYPRALVTRHTALYSSLSTSYAVEFDTPSAVASPFSTNPGFQLLVGQQPQPVVYRRDGAVYLQDFRVASNSTGMLRAEYFLPANQGIEWQAAEATAPRVTNNSPWKLHGVSILRRVAGRMEAAWVGELAARQPQGVSFKAWAEARPMLQTNREQSPITANNPPPGTVSLRSLVRIAEEPFDLVDGDVRLVGWTDEEVPGMSVEPRTPQRQHIAMVVANLQKGLGPPTKPDVNSRADVRVLDPEDDEEFIEPFNPLEVEE